MNRRNQILAGILALQLVVGAIVLWPRPATSEGEGPSLFPDLEADRIAGLTITSTEGKSIQLAKRGIDWVLPEFDDYPVLKDRVTPVLDKIAGLKADRVVTQTSSSHKRLKVADGDFVRLVEFELADGTRHRLWVGTSPSYSATHVRADDQNEVYLASELSAQDVGFEATAWVDRTYLDVPQDEIVALTLENANGRFEFEKEGETWTMKGLAAGETLDDGSVTTLVNQARLTTLLRPLGKQAKEAYGLQEPSATITIRTHSDETGDKTYVLQVGAKDPADNSYPVKSSESDYYVRVSEFAVKDFVEKARDGFLQLPPTPEATPEG